MFSTLRTRFGIPGVISVIALVFAMFGGAYAASNSSGGGKATASAKAKKGPKGPKGATGPAGPAGAQGPAGPAGAKGDPGANGSNGGVGPTGPTGAAGAHGATGATGATGFSGFTETLPAGKTETGAWAITQAFFNGTEANTSVAANTAISFPIPLAAEGAEGSAWVFTESEVAQEKWGRKEANTSEPCTVGEPECLDTKCRGTVAVPTAPPGVLCAYTQYASSIPAASATPPTEFTNFTGSSGAFGQSGAILSGAVLHPSPGQTASIEAVGTWAVTAPQ